MAFLRLRSPSLASLHTPTITSSSSSPSLSPSPSPSPSSRSRVSIPTSSAHISSSLSAAILVLRSKSLNFLLSGTLALGLSLAGRSENGSGHTYAGAVGFAEAKVGVNKPELLPKEYTPVIDIAGFLSDGQEKRLAQEIADIEKDTGFKLRVLAQNYPDTPGLAIKDFWSVDDQTIVFVADPTFGNIINFNVGASVDLDIPRSFWSRLAGKYGNIFYWKEKGEDASIEAAVMAISNCLKEPVGPNNCSENHVLKMHFQSDSEMEVGTLEVFGLGTRNWLCEVSHEDEFGMYTDLSHTCKIENC